MSSGSSNLTKFYEIMRKLDEAISDVEKVREQVKSELDSYLRQVEDDLRKTLNDEISKLVNEYKLNAELSVKKEVDEYVHKHRSVIEFIRNNRDRIINEASSRVLKELGFATA
ncbi:hypothetical protein [Caldivirga maquilingensis]|uniref:Uncharacterized protein n=1 Tax=Caldivirga maquilingensis (strain ATCC 700844 / DSM 13496 / JCM 10307 / IC-167) TaxID=397948 RepID=A8MD41_CALMQ|nr:hypothetical protein [Caldivirga maquilingensis]ABW01697.1 hypothetical protein Cmaq_0862 [Caldivirga maquilingensis IC-167]